VGKRTAWLHLYILPTGGLRTQSEKQKSLPPSSSWRAKAQAKACHDEGGPSHHWMIRLVLGERLAACHQMLFVLRHLRLLFMALEQGRAGGDSI
jgi:hypothetical protein